MYFPKVHIDISHELKFVFKTPLPYIESIPTIIRLANCHFTTISSQSWNFYNYNKVIYTRPDINVLNMHAICVNGALFLCCFSEVVQFNTSLISTWEENELSNWRNDNYFHSKWQLFCYSHSHSALCNVYPVALDRNRR